MRSGESSRKLSNSNGNSQLVGCLGKCCLYVLLVLRFFSVKKLTLLNKRLSSGFSQWIVEGCRLNGDARSALVNSHLIKSMEWVSKLLRISFHLNK